MCAILYWLVEIHARCLQYRYLPWKENYIWYDMTTIITKCYCWCLVLHCLILFLKTRWYNSLIGSDWKDLCHFEDIFEWAYSFEFILKEHHSWWKSCGRRLNDCLDEWITSQWWFCRCVCVCVYFNDIV